MRQNPAAFLFLVERGRPPEDQVIQGTAFLIDRKWQYLITARHVAGERSENLMLQTAAGDRYSGRCVFVSGAHDTELAVIQCHDVLPPAAQPLPMAKRFAYGMTDELLFFGFLGDGGIISVPGKLFDTKPQTVAVNLVPGIIPMLDFFSFMRGDIQLDPGSSGGPVLNRDGECVGVIQSSALYGGSRTHFTALVQVNRFLRRFYRQIEK